MAPGGVVAHYRIVSRLGAGGMGEVFLAEDEKLQRQVALKILSPEVARHPDRIERFIQEARAASSLNHINVAQIYELGESDAMRYIAMEYVDGKTLTRRIGEGQMDLREILEVGIQTADVLDEAHARGIIHRDIKPANLMLSSRGQLKVLDFGLAKLAAPVDASAETVTSVLTSPGVVMGTVQYMSPEQALGREVDRRSDIFSLGAVLYEMGAGFPPFHGDTQIAIIDAILHQPPAWPFGLNPALRRVLEKALEKDRDLRYQTASDMRADLKRLKRDIDSAPTVEMPAAMEAPRKRFMLPVVVAAALVTLLAAFGAWLWMSRAPLPTPKVVPFTSYPGSELHPAISPDGNLVAFSWNGEQEEQYNIYVKQVGAAGSPLKLTNTPENETFPAWSPDGRYVAFFRSSPSSAGYYAVPALGGPERRLTEVAPFGRVIWPASASWSPDGRFLAVADQPPGASVRAIFLASIETGQQRQVTFPPPTGMGDGSPSFAPDGHSLAFVRSTAGSATALHVVAMTPGGSTAGEPRSIARLNRFVSSPAWTPDGRDLIFAMVRGGSPMRLIRVPAAGGGMEPVPNVPAPAEYPSVSRAGGRLVYVYNVYDMDILRLAVGSSAAPVPFAVSTQSENSMRFSPDGKRVVFGSDRTGTAEIWLADIDGGNVHKLTSFESGTTGSPSWSPDGRSIVFDARPDGNPEIYVMDVDGGTARRMTNHPAEDVVPAWSADGRWLFFGSTRAGSFQIWKMPAQGGEPVQVSRNGGFGAIASPDGKWLYYLKGRGSVGVWRMPVAGGDEVPVNESIADRNWYPVEDGLYLLRREPPGPASKRRWLVQFYRFATRQYETLAEMSKPPSAFFPCLAVSPDRKTILYSQLEHRIADLMLVEDFN